MVKPIMPGRVKMNQTPLKGILEGQTAIKITDSEGYTFEFTMNGKEGYVVIHQYGSSVKQVSFGYMSGAKVTATSEDGSVYDVTFQE